MPHNGPPNQHIRLVSWVT